MQTFIGATNIISSLGFSTKENFSNLLSYISGIRPVDDTSVTEVPLLAAQVDRQKLLSEAQVNGLSGYTMLEQMLILSVKDVVNCSGVNPADKSCGFIFSTTKGNINLIGSIDSLKAEVYLNEMAKRVASYFGSSATPIVVSNACISGVSAMILASRLIREGVYENVIVAGGDLLTRFVVSGFSAFKSVSTKPCLPYDSTRDGLSLGEGCASLLISSNEKFSEGVVLEGGAITNDANHISGPSRTGDGLCYAIEQAVEESGVDKGQVTFINAHGTATPFNDEMESKAINMAGMNSLYVNSLKSYFGHTLGAAGVIESIMCAEQLKSGVAIGTKGFGELGVPQPIVVSGEHQKLSMKRCVKTASGFGGCNAAIVLALQQFSGTIISYPAANVRQVATCTIKDSKLSVNGEVVFQSTDENYSTFIRSAFKELNVPNMKFYKMDNLCKLGYLAAEYLLKDTSFNSNEVAVLMANRSSSLDSDCAHQQVINEHGEQGASPAVFVYTLPNVVLGEVCIRHKIQGENTFLVSDRYPEMLDSYVKNVLGRPGYKVALIGWCEQLGDSYEANLKLIEKV